MSNLVVAKQCLASAEKSFIGISGDEKKYKRECNFAVQSLQANSYMLQQANANPNSLRNAIINLASMGLTLNPAEKKAYLVPYGGKNPRVDLQISYMGLIDLAISDGAIMWAQAKVVRQNDLFNITGVDTPPEHKYNPFDSEQTRGDVIGVYCVAKFPNSDYITEIMSITDINSIKSRSSGVKSGNTTPWDTDFDEMAKKTVIKRASKYWKGSSKLSKAIDFLNNENNEGINFNKQEEKPKQNINDLMNDDVVDIDSEVGDE
ncbi:recombinase RecT [Candidatus Francisella endociliophora]|uniref:recombinase RecT n=1 Tax=Candidatus Francisella endociliophora TaxID=653937 RepID=UPI000693E85E|nr:recombinase RecT [Francisella sp. FSC1006]